MNFHILEQSIGSDLRPTRLFLFNVNSLIFKLTRPKLRLKAGHLDHSYMFPCPSSFLPGSHQRLSAERPSWGDGQFDLLGSTSLQTLGLSWIRRWRWAHTRCSRKLCRATIVRCLQDFEVRAGHEWLAIYPYWFHHCRRALGNKLPFP